jgi:thiol-disulfide isomerase/thioredoxin
MLNKKNPLLYVALILFAAFAGYFIYDNFFAPKPVGEVGITMGNMLLDQTIPSVDGNGSVSFSDYRGKVLVIDFLAPRCDPCKEQVGVLAEVASIDGVEVISINIDRNYDMLTLQVFGAEEGIIWFFGHNPPSALDFEVDGIPTVIVVDKNGLIVRRGYFMTIQEFDMILPQLLG